MSCLTFGALVLAAGLLPPEDPQRPPVRSVTQFQELAGDYFLSKGIGASYSLTITTDGQFEFVWSGCLGVYDYNTGDAKFVDGRLVLKPRMLNPERMFRLLDELSEELLEAWDQDLLVFTLLVSDIAAQGLPRLALRLLCADGIPTEYIPVRWGQRLYLVPKGEGHDFCNSINQGHLSRYPSAGFYLREDNADKSVEGLPSVPEEWKPLLLAKPLHGKVTEVLSDVRAKVNFGAESGAWKGMHLCIDSTDGWAEVVEVGPRSCLIQVHRDKDWVEVGREVQTRKPTID